jgi:hypothetical protein
MDYVVAVASLANTVMCIFQQTASWPLKSGLRSLHVKMVRVPSPLER